MSILYDVICPGPDQNIAIPAHLRSPALVTAEETGTLWLWAWPKLLGWHTEITWLFSPVTGKWPWPGDLWGLDATGNLLIVETKIARAKRGKDPFEDLVGFERSNPRGEKGLSVLDSDALTQHWQPLFQDEQKFINERSQSLRQGNWDQHTDSGIVPYSYKRVEVWRWREVYLENIAKYVQSPRYEETVRRNLRTRTVNGSPGPHYIGFFTVCPGGEPRLSTQGQRNYETLCNEVTSMRVHLLAATAKEIQPGKVRIESWRLE